MSKNYGLSDVIKTSKLGKVYGSRKMREFEGSFPCTAEQVHMLAFGAVLTVQNTDSWRTFKLKADKSQVIMALNESWDVRNRESALDTVESLSTAAGHTPFADDAYKSFALKGKLTLLRIEDLHNLTGLENAYNSTVNRVHGSAVNPDDLTDEEREAVMSALVNRLNYGTVGYLAARDMLIDLGYTESELLAVKTTAAWDLGRTGIIARWCEKAGFIEEAEMWSFLDITSKNAVKSYHDWREYLAGYIFGRALAYGSDSADIHAELKFLLTGKKSPFKEISFVGRY